MSWQIKPAKNIEFWVSDLKLSLEFYRVFLLLSVERRLKNKAFSNGQTKIYFIEQKLKLLKTISPRYSCFLTTFIS